jgi:hypothetical protein
VSQQQTSEARVNRVSQAGREYDEVTEEEVNRKEAFKKQSSNICSMVIKGLHS